MKAKKVPIQRALISVSNKDNLIGLANSLVDLGIEIISTGGTAIYLKKEGVDVKEVSELTGFPEILNGRVKTLHPKVHAPILFDRDDKDSAQQITKIGVNPIDLVIVNLYPFEKFLKSKAVRQDIIENIDIGGVALLRAAAKNFDHVTVISDPDDYFFLKKELISFQGCTTQKTREYLAAKAFSHTSFYDSLITDWFLSKKEFPPMQKRVFAGTSQRNLKYGENPHQSAVYLKNPLLKLNKNSSIDVLQGTLSYNNLIDCTAAYKIICELENYRKATSVIIKHGNPCGASINNKLLEAYKKSIETDPISAFGGIVGVNQEVNVSLARRILSIFTEVIIAKHFSEGALKVFNEKKKVKVVRINKFDGSLLGKEEVRSVIGGYIAQETANSNLSEEKYEIVTKRKPTKKEYADMVFLWKIVKHVKSNAIVIGAENHVMGIGAGQTNRVGSVDIAIQNSKRLKKNNRQIIKNDFLAMASDAFFPFPDSIKKAAKGKISCIIQPGGSINDTAVIKAADRLNMAMVFTGKRVFSH